MTLETPPSSAPLAGLTAARADQALLRANAAMARDYDELPYEPVALPAVLPPRALGLAAVYGCGGHPGAGGAAAEVLDLGCGLGALLAAAGASARGRLVGVDISAVSCALARERLAPLGDRARVLQGDLLTLDADGLGRFDVIYCIGVASLLPPPVRRAMLRLLGRCLRPGGVAVVSYYAGTLPRLRACLYEGLRAAVRGDRPRAAQVQLARRQLDQLAASLPPEGPLRGVLAQVLALSAGGSDALLYHEALGSRLRVLRTSSLEAQLRPAGLRFLGYLQPAPFLALPSGRQRALGADAFDFTSGGGYRYAVFCRPAGEEQGPTARAPALRWSTALRRVEPGPYGGEARYHDGSCGASLSRPGTQALMDELALGPAPFAAACLGARRRLEAQGLALGAVEEALVEADLLTLWRAGLTTAEAALATGA